MKLADLFIKLGLKSDDFNKGIEGVKAKTSGLGAAFSKIGPMIAGAFSVAAIVGFTKQLFEAGKMQVDVLNKLSSAIKANGKDLNSTLKEYTDFASKIQDTSTVNDEAVLSLLQLAESYNAFDTKKAVKEAIALSKALGIDDSIAVKYATLAQEGQFNAIGRLVPGIKSATTESRKFLEYQKLINSGLQIMSGETETLVGKSHQLSNIWSDIKEDFGSGLVESKTVKGFLEFLKDAVKTISNYDKAGTKWWEVLMGPTGVLFRDARAKSMAFKEQIAKDSAAAVDEYQKMVDGWEQSSGKAMSQIDKIKLQLASLYETIEDSGASDIVKKEAKDQIIQLELQLSKLSGTATTISERVSYLQKRLGELYKLISDKSIDFNTALKIREQIGELESEFQSLTGFSFPKLREETIKANAEFKILYDTLQKSGGDYVIASTAIQRIRQLATELEKVGGKLDTANAKITGTAAGAMMKPIGAKAVTTKKEDFSESQDVDEWYNFFSSFQKNMSLDDMEESYQKWRELTESLTSDVLENWQSFAMDFKNLIQSQIIDTIALLSESIVDLFEGDITFADFGKSILKSIGNFLSQLGAMMIAFGFAAKHFALLQLAMANPALALAIAPAAITYGAILLGFGTAIGAFGSSGGKSKGSTSGNYSNSASGSFAVNSIYSGGQIQGKLRGNEIQLLLTREQSRKAVIG